MDKALFEMLKKIMEGTQCPKNFRCAEHGFDDICKAVTFGLDNYLECQDDSPRDCTYAVKSGKYYFCQCPVRLFISKKKK